MLPRFRISLVILPALAWFILTGQAPQRGVDRGFTLYARAIIDENRESSVKVSVNVAYPRLIFLKKGDVYEAKYDLFLKIVSRKNKPLKSTVLKETVVVTTYADTKSIKKTSRLSHSFKVPPGQYVVAAAVLVENTHLVYEKQAEVTVSNLLEHGIGITKPRLFATVVDTVLVPLRRDRSGEYPQMEEKEKNEFADFGKQPTMMFDVHLEAKTEKTVPCEIIYEVLAEDESQILYGRKSIHLTGVDDRYVVTFNVDDWDLGDYVFNVKAAIDDPETQATSKLKFVLQVTRAILTKYFDKTVGILSIIGSGEEIAAFRNAAEDDRARVWADFWKRRDPTPDTDHNEALIEHLGRAQHVEDTFSAGEEGWKTDRGRVYIKYGRPDEVEVQVDPNLQGEYLIWRYHNADRTFVFHDRFGLAEYRLTNPNDF